MASVLVRKCLVLSCVMNTTKPQPTPTALSPKARALAAAGLTPVRLTAFEAVRFARADAANTNGQKAVRRAV